MLTPRVTFTAGECRLSWASTSSVRKTWVLHDFLLYISYVPMLIQCSVYIYRQPGILANNPKHSPLRYEVICRAWLGLGQSTFSSNTVCVFLTQSDFAKVDSSHHNPYVYLGESLWFNSFTQIGNQSAFMKSLA